METLATIFSTLDKKIPLQWITLIAILYLGIKIHSVENKIHSVDSKIYSVENKLGNHITDTNKKIDKLSDRFDKLSDRLTGKAIGLTDCMRFF